MILLTSESNFLTDIVLPVSMGVIALAAFIISIWSIWEQRRHNRKSVRPIGHIQISDSVQSLNIKIVNQGFGALFIKDFIADKNGQVEHNLIYHLPNNILRGITHKVHTQPEGYWLQPGGELVLISYEGSQNNPGFVRIRDAVRAGLCDIDMKLTYVDIYDKKQPTFVKPLDWLARAL